MDRALPPLAIESDLQERAGDWAPTQDARRCWSDHTVTLCFCGGCHPLTGTPPSCAPCAPCALDALDALVAEPTDTPRFVRVFESTQRKRRKSPCSPAPAASLQGIVAEL